MSVSNADLNLPISRNHHSLPRVFKPCTSMQNVSCVFGVHDFRVRLSRLQHWFGQCSDQQKNTVLQELMYMCGPSQTHLLTLRLRDWTPMMTSSDSSLNYNRGGDFLSSLPPHVIFKILLLLDAVSLARCGRVCRQWRVLAGCRALWQRMCTGGDWLVSPDTHSRQLAECSLVDGQVNWRQVFERRYRLRRNWLQGQCHVRTFEGHCQGVTCVQFDDIRIVSGSHDKSIKVWNIRTNSPWSVMTLLGHSGSVRCLHLLDNRLVSGSTDTTIKVWDISTQQLCWSSIACKVTMVGHTDTVRCVQMDGSKVVSGSYDKQLRVWRLDTGECQRVLAGHTGQILCLRFQDDVLVSGAADTTIKVWRLNSGLCERTLVGHDAAVTTLTFTSQRIISGSLDCTIRMWALSSGQHLATLDWMKSEGHTGVVRCLVADQWRLISASDDKTLKVWSLQSGRRLVTLRQHSDGVTCVQFNDVRIVSGSYDKSVKLWDFSAC